ncbi:MAG: hypothetical protein ACXAE3_08345 [Candidatus Kariarchaeaceae archaeon]|jgi:hypothetical protein
MPGLTLLNIDRETTSTGNPLTDIREIITEIEEFIGAMSGTLLPARAMPLKMKLRRLQDSVSQFGADDTITVEEKQTAIMELHPDLQMLINRLQRFGNSYSVLVEICMNYLLNHLCSTAASDPKSTVIGVSNVMAQVLSNDISILAVPELSIASSEPKYFEEFSRQFNAMLTTAGLFAAPVLGLPDIPISALGAWADQALSQFSNINQYVKRYYDPNTFYLIDKQENAIPFDTTTDVLSFYVYENEFLAALIARADILSGLEFPGAFSRDGNPVTLQSTEEITILLADSIIQNCGEIINHMNTIDRMFKDGIIDRNERPEDHPDLMQFRDEAQLWELIAKFAKLMVSIFLKEPVQNDLRGIEDLHHPLSELPPVDEEITPLQKRLLILLDEFQRLIFDMFPTAKSNRAEFIKSSGFTRFRDYFRFLIHIIAAHDIHSETNKIWLPWFLDSFKQLTIGETTQYGPINAVEVGILATILGVNFDVASLTEQGKMILTDVRPFLEFQSHHALSIEILLKLTQISSSTPDVVASNLSADILQFFEKHQINPNSMLFQRATLYQAMLEMYKETGIYLRKSNERFVAFDPFSWIIPGEDSGVEFPYMPLNTSLDNLNSN